MNSRKYTYEKIILTTLMILSFSLATVYAQSDYRDAFTGTWIWYNNTDTFRIKFKKGIINIDADVPCLYGYHEYKSGNTVLESSLKNYDADIAMKLYTIETWVPRKKREDNITNLFVGSIADVEYKDNMYMKRDLTLTLSPDKKSMQFEAIDEERVIFIIEGANQSPNELLPKDRTTFFFPKEATFIKENQ